MIRCTNVNRISLSKMHLTGIDLACSKVLSKLEEMLNKFTPGKLCDVSKDLHVWPDFHGNRSPLADPTLKGMISGLTLAHSRDDLAVVYLATIQALAVRQI
jgi:ribulose kinase